MSEKTQLLRTGLSWKQASIPQINNVTGFIPINSGRINEEGVLFTNSEGLIDTDTSEGVLVNKYINTQTSEVLYLLEGLLLTEDNQILVTENDEFIVEG